ncbi:hypothetical protein S7711_07472 [Stachybotrys chartarum IBT 7711]|uniref:Uncharacterized protein n=1 Tax=Stachybotrys chartarum (strain CBS 109288 / IBT 7711) TaxID=1280523 RepID=A0A084AFP8_STACB|nr:hypothetical protein S7711_07472 [Stachybotrys chartarum IBT 7711]KFA50863.1 hypothetical protein S40293_02494 [Stachybotrys chartarum IBT 40293]KFA74861.1 hypothetical protein S40288_06479 [Stachybotrys chartarum IBT 40288]
MSGGEESWTWFPNGRLEWSLDIVTLLAVIGESSIADHAQAITSSTLCLLPKLIPAPQALLKPSRPTRMPEVKAHMSGVYSGINLDSIGFFASIITPLDSLPALSFQVLHIKHSRRAQEHGQQQQLRRSVTEKVQDLITSPTLIIKDERPAVPPRLFSPLHILSVSSFVLTIGIIIAGIFWEDGPAIMAVTLISITSTIAGYASLWRPILMYRRHKNEVPRGDVLIRTREAAFVLIKCTEEVARELYSGTEICDYYVGDQSYRLLMGLATMLLMMSVILLGNCQWNSQVLIGASYIILNGLYWGLGMLPQSQFWDLSRYEFKDVTPPDAVGAHVVTDEDNSVEGYPSFTRTLWYAIRETKLTGWAERSGAAPNSEQWQCWLREAQENAMRGNRSWNAVARKNALMKMDVSHSRAPQPDSALMPAIVAESNAESGGRDGVNGSPSSNSTVGPEAV